MAIEILSIDIPQGRVKYRNGAVQQANEIWKPLLTRCTENLLFHNIKQEIMRYYFDKEPYRESINSLY